MSSITDDTCDWGLAQTAAGCVRTLASYDPSSYQLFQIIYWSVGAVSLLASGVMYYRSVKYDGSRLQHHIFVYCCYASATIIARGVDPRSYNHITPRPIGSLLADSCTAALYSIYILALGYWATIIQQGAAIVNKPRYLKCLEISATALVWVFYIIYDLYLFTTKGFNPQGIAYITLTVSACMLGIISTTFLIYGLRVHTRLQDYERMKKRAPSLQSERRMENHSFNLVMSDDEDGVPVVAMPQSIRPRPTDGHAAKIRKILMVAESVSLIVIAGQMYMAVELTTSTPVELSCANGLLCSTVKSSVNLLHLLQVVAVWAILWCFRKINKREVVPQPRMGP